VVKLSGRLLDRVFFALSDPIRRDMIFPGWPRSGFAYRIIDPLSNLIASSYEHLSVLEDSGLVRTAKVGRVRKCEVDAHPLQLAHGWIDVG
jgi:hypothetical protein